MVKTAFLPTCLPTVWRNTKAAGAYNSDVPTPPLLLLFSPARLVRVFFVFAAVVGGLYLLALVLRYSGVFAGSPFFPVNVFSPRAQSFGLVISALVVWLAGVGGIVWLDRRRKPQRYPVWGVCAVGLLLILGANGLQGVGPHRRADRGFAFPVSGKTGANGILYYHDANSALVVSPTDFIRHFPAIQPRLRDHGRTHPPGAVLLFYALSEATGNRPALIGVFIAAFSVLLSGGSMARLVQAVLPPESAPCAGYAALLLLLLSATQIYFCASLDGVVAALLLASVALACEKRTFFAASCVFAASFLTFGVVWVVPVLLVLEGRRKTWARLGGVIGVLLVSYLLLYAVFGFNYVAALQTASRLENPHGFRLVTDPIGYAMTRLGDVAEIALFAGPFVVWLAFRGITRLRKTAPDAFWLFASAFLSLGGLFLTGAYRTGETARACIFVYPFLLLPVLAALRKNDAKNAGEPNGAEKTLLLLVWTQSVVMQVIGDYFW